MVTTSGIQKFYSNGLDLDHASWTPGFFTDSLYALWRRLLVYPMPTIALINGHAFAGALMLVMMHDYRIMNPHRGFVCLNEVELGVPLRPPMSSVFRQKVGSHVYRTLVLEAKRYKVRRPWATLLSLVSNRRAPHDACTNISSTRLSTHSKRASLTVLAASTRLSHTLLR